jgi:hypothetical protein
MNDAQKPQVPPTVRAPAGTPAVPKPELTAIPTWDTIDVAKVLETYVTDDGMKLRHYPPRKLPDGTTAEQVWARGSLEGKPDIANLMALKAKGWLPRPAETVTNASLETLVGFYPSQVSVISGGAGSILMERHQKLGDAERRLVEEATRGQLQSVKRNVNSQSSYRNGARLGGMEVEVMNSSRRAPRVQTDD